MSTDNRVVYDPTTMGFNKHDYRHIDPDTINPDSYARTMNGEEQHFGDVREYNSAYNTKHPDNNAELDWFGRMGTIIETEAVGFEGQWMVVAQPKVKAPDVWAVMSRIDEAGEPIEDTVTDVPLMLLGCVVKADNLYDQVKTVLVSKGKVDRSQRARLTKR